MLHTAAAEGENATEDITHERGGRGAGEVFYRLQYTVRATRARAHTPQKLTET